MLKNRFRFVMLLIILQAVSGSFAFDDGSNKVKQEEDEATTVSVDRAKEMAEHENYLQDKQDLYERLRGMSATQTRLKALRGGETQNSKEKKPETTQEKFLKEKSKTPEEEKEESKKQKAKEENRTEIKKPKLPENVVLPQVKSLDDEEKKVNHFYQLRLLLDYRSGEQIHLKDPRKLKENQKDQKSKAVQSREQVLDNVPFLRDTTLSPYLLDEEDIWERWD